MQQKFRSDFHLANKGQDHELLLLTIVFSRLSSSLRSVMKERMVVRRNLIDIEAAEKDLQVKLYRKVNCF